MIAPVADVPVVDSTYDWSGLYIGGNAGYGWGSVETFFPAPSPLVGSDPSVTGFLLGVDVGANMQMDSFVLGLEGNLAWANIEGSEVCPNDDFDCLASIDWVGDISARAGIAMDSVLLYGKLGVAAAGVTVDYDPAFMDEGNTTNLGYVAGVGLAIGVTEDVSLFAEYNYYGFGEETIEEGTFQVDDVEVTPSLQTVKVGANFHF
jgi:outer membrane immunogenic protein